MVPNAYRFAAAAAHRIPLPESKLAQSRLGRKGAARRWEDWASRERTTGPLVWVHGASVGEGLTAAPVTARLRAAVAGIQIVHTFSSPSAARWPGAFGADRADFAPLDEEGPVARTLDALRPDVLVFSRGDLWPELTVGAHRAGVPLAVLGATVRPTSKRLRWPFKPWFRRVHQAVGWLGAATEADAVRWRRLGVQAGSVVVTGDPRHDQIIERVPRMDSIRSLLAWAHTRTVLVAGSTEARDERMLLAAFEQLSTSNTPPGLVLVPHDPAPQRISRITRLAKRHGSTAAVWRGGPLELTADCVVVATIGLLADLYLAGDIAYVGGGFRTGRLHAVVEPACYALPVLFGPDYGALPDAVELVRSGGAAPLPRHAARGAVHQILRSLLHDHDRRAEMGMRARATLSQGAARTTVAALLRLMETGHPTECPAPRS